METVLDELVVKLSLDDAEFVSDLQQNVQMLRALKAENDQAMREVTAMSMAGREVSAKTAAMPQPMPEIGSSMPDLKEIPGIIEEASAGMERLKNISEEVSATLERGFGAVVRGLEDNLVNFVRTGEFSFKNLRDTALQALNDILNSFIRTGINQLFTQSFGGFFSGLFSAFAGRASGGPVNPQRAFLVGERGPEVFIPPSNGRIAPLVGGATAGQGRPISVTVNVNNNSPQPMGRESTGQIALAVRRAVQRAARDQ